jgi:outer membrane receptor protein involved in Fe transport
VNSAIAVGRTLSQGNVTALSGLRNEDSYDPLSLLDLRLGYELPIARPGISLALDIFNTLNVNTISSVQVLSGSAYNRVLAFVPPRILRFGGKVRF